MIITGVRIPQPLVCITNLYDMIAATHGSSELHSVGVFNWVVDLNVLSLELPAQVVELLGLSAEQPDSLRLPPVRLNVRCRAATIDPFLASGEQVVIGYGALTALGLKYDPEWGLMDDTDPSR